LGCLQLDVRRFVLRWVWLAEVSDCDTFVSGYVYFNSKIRSSYSFVSRRCQMCDWEIFISTTRIDSDLPQSSDCHLLSLFMIIFIRILHPSPLRFC
jgi:hypothetical protein